MKAQQLSLTIHCNLMIPKYFMLFYGNYIHVIYGVFLHLPDCLFLSYQGLSPPIHYTSDKLS